QTRGRCSGAVGRNGPPKLSCEDDIYITRCRTKCTAIAPRVYNSDGQPARPPRVPFPGHPPSWSLSDDCFQTGFSSGHQHTWHDLMDVLATTIRRLPLRN